MNVRVEVRMDHSKPLGRRTASNDDVEDLKMPPRSGRRHTALSKSSSFQQPPTRYQTSPRAMRVSGFDGRQMEEGEDLDEFNRERRTLHKPRRNLHLDEDDEEDEQQDEEEEGNDWQSGGRAVPTIIDRLPGIRRNRISSLPSLGPVPISTVPTAIPRHLLLRQRSESHPPDRAFSTRDFGTPEAEEAQIDDMEEDEEEDIGHQHDDRANHGSGARTISPRIYVPATSDLPALDIDITQGDRNSPTDRSMLSKSTSVPAVSPRLRSSTHSGSSPSSSPPQPSLVSSVPVSLSHGSYPRTNSVGTMSPRKPKSRRGLMSASLSSSSIMRAPPLHAVPDSPHRSSRISNSEPSMDSTPPRRPLHYSGLSSAPLMAVPALNFDETDPCTKQTTSRTVPERRPSTTSIDSYELELQAQERGLGLEVSHASPDISSRSAQSDQQVSELEDSGTATSSSGSRHSRSRSFNRLSLSLQPSGISPRGNSSSLTMSATVPTSPGRSPRSPPSYSPLSTSPKTIPGSFKPSSPRTIGFYDSGSPPLRIPPPSPATTPSSSTAAVEIPSGRDAFHTYARSFDVVQRSYANNSASEDSEEGESSHSTSRGHQRRRRDIFGRNEAARRDSDSGESDNRESEGEGSGGESVYSTTPHGTVYRADTTSSLLDSPGFKPRKSLFADPKKRYKSHTLQHQSRSNRGLGIHASTGVLSLPEENTLSLERKKEELRRANAERRAAARLAKRHSSESTESERKYGSDGEKRSVDSSEDTLDEGSTKNKSRRASMRTTASEMDLSPRKDRSKRYSLESPGMRVSKASVKEPEEKKPRAISKELKQEIEEHGGATRRALRNSSGVERKNSKEGAENEETERSEREKPQSEGFLKRLHGLRQSRTFHALPLNEIKQARDPSPRDTIRKKDEDTLSEEDSPASRNGEQLSDRSERKGSKDNGSRDATPREDQGEKPAPEATKKHKGLFLSFVSLPRKSKKGKKGTISKDHTPPSPLVITPSASPRGAPLHHLESSSGSHPTVQARRQRLLEASRKQRKASTNDRLRRRHSMVSLEDVRNCLPVSTSQSISSAPPVSPRHQHSASSAAFLSRKEKQRLMRNLSFDERMLDEDVLEKCLEIIAAEQTLGENQTEPATDTNSGDAESGLDGSSSGERRPERSGKQRQNNLKLRGRTGPIHSPKLARKAKPSKQSTSSGRGLKDTTDDNRLLNLDNFDQLLLNRELLLAELTRPGLRLVRGLLSVVSASNEDEPVDALCQALVEIADRHGHVNQLMKLAIDQELSIRVSPFTLFREDSLGTKFLSTYAREKGGAYLRAVLKPVIKKVISSHNSYEMDPLRIQNDSKGSVREDNQRRLEKLCHHILESIFARQGDFPLYEGQSSDSMKKSYLRLIHDRQLVSSHLYAEVNKKFPYDPNGTAWSTDEDDDDDETALQRSSDWGLACVGAFIFLRFFCPAIVSPKPYGIVKRPPTREAQRGLMLVAKTLQTMANRLRFGDKESFMKPMNQFIEDNQASLENYLRALCQKPSKSQTRFAAPEKEKKPSPSLREKFSAGNSSSSTSLLALSTASAGNLSLSISSAAVAADPGDEESAQLNVVQNCCIRNHRKLLTFYYSSSLPFLSSLCPNPAALANGTSSGTSSAASSGNNSPSSSAPPTPSSRSVSPRITPFGSVAPQANAALNSNSTSLHGGE